MKANADKQVAPLPEMGIEEIDSRKHTERMEIGEMNIVIPSQQQAHWRKKTNVNCKQTLIFINFCGL